MRCKVIWGKNFSIKFIHYKAKYSKINELNIEIKD